MDDKELSDRLREAALTSRYDDDMELIRLAAARLTALADENERLRKAVRDAHVDLGASGGITEIECSCEVCRGEP